MKLATIDRDGVATPAFAFDDRIVALTDAYAAAGLGAAPVTMLALLESGDAAGRLAAAHDAARDLSGIEATGWLPPVKGFKILSTAINNAGVAKLASVVPDNPPFFLKPPSAMIGQINRSSSAPIMG